MLSVVFAGCSGSNPDSVVIDSSSQSQIATDQSDVEIEPPESKVTVKPTALDDGTTTCEIRAHGTCNLHKHNRENVLEFALEGRMKYRVRISLSPWVKDSWHINPLLDISNDTDALMHCHYYAAFFNDDGRIVGCCNQGTSVEPSDRPRQLGSLVIEGLKEQLLLATSFKIVIYESDKQIGIEPIVRSVTETMIGRSGKVVTRLDQTDSSINPGEGSSEIRLLANVAFEDPAERPRNTYLQMESAVVYDIYCNAGLKDVLVTSPGKDPVRFSRWEIDAEFERRKRVKGVSANYHAALLDDDGELIACSTIRNGRRLAVPEDKLLSIRKLDLIAVETVKQNED